MAAEKEKADAQLAQARLKEEMAKEAAERAEKEKNALQAALDRQQSAPPTSAAESINSQLEKANAELRRRLEATEKVKEEALAKQAQLQEQMSKTLHEVRDLLQQKQPIGSESAASASPSSRDSAGGAEEAASSPRNASRKNLMERLAAKRAAQQGSTPPVTDGDSDFKRILEQKEKQLADAQAALRDAMTTRSEISKLTAQIDALKPGQAPASPSGSAAQVQDLGSLVDKLKAEAKANAEAKAKLDEERRELQKEKIAAKKESQLAISERMQHLKESILGEIQTKRVKFEDLAKHFNTDIFQIIQRKNPIIQQRYVEMIKSKGFSNVWREYRDEGLQILDGETLEMFKRFGAFLLQKEKEYNLKIDKDGFNGIQDLKKKIEARKQKYEEDLRVRSNAEIDLYITMVSRQQNIAASHKDFASLSMVDKPKSDYERDLKNLQNEFARDFEEPYLGEIGSLENSLHLQCSHFDDEANCEEREDLKIINRQYDEQVQKINMAFSKWLNDNVFKKEEVTITPSSSAAAQASSKKT
jgi:hypothetical protein